MVFETLSQSSSLPSNMALGGVRLLRRCLEYPSSTSLPRAVRVLQNLTRHSSSEVSIPAHFWLPTCSAKCDLKLYHNFCGNLNRAKRQWRASVFLPFSSRPLRQAYGLPWQVCGQGLWAPLLRRGARLQRFYPSSRIRKISYTVPKHNVTNQRVFPLYQHVKRISYTLSKRMLSHWLYSLFF